MECRAGWVIMNPIGGEFHEIASPTFLRVAEGSDRPSPYQWQRTGFQPGRRVRPSTQPDPHLGHAGARSGRACFGAPGRPATRIEQVKDRKIEHLQAKLVQKNEVIAELMEDHVKLKKDLGEP